MRGVGVRALWICASLLLSTPVPGSGQDGVETFAGVLAGVSALSADTSTSASSPDEFQLSTYAPTNGGAFNLFVGAHLADYVTLQANYLWNRNQLRFQTGVVAGGASSFDSVTTASSQQGVVGDFLLFFRDRRSPVRPYLSAGAGVFRFASDTIRDDAPSVSLLPSGTFTTVTPVLRVAVGIDIAVGPTWSVRYSFSEGISPNPIGERLTPAGQRVLMNFQNLVGVMATF